MEDSIKEPAKESVWVEVLILSGIESARHQHILDYAIARMLVSFCGEPPGIPAGRRYAAAILHEHPDKTIGDSYSRVFLQN
jgi:hypothetical protein